MLEPTSADSDVPASIARIADDLVRVKLLRLLALALVAVVSLQGLSLASLMSRPPQRVWMPESRFVRPLTLR